MNCSQAFEHAASISHSHTIMHGFARDKKNWAHEIFGWLLWVIEVNVFQFFSTRLFIKCVWLVSRLVHLHYVLIVHKQAVSIRAHHAATPQSSASLAPSRPAAVSLAVASQPTANHPIHKKPSNRRRDVCGDYMGVKQAA